MLHAAWVLDDAKKDELARLCRSDVADSFSAALASGDTFSKQAGGSEAIIVDCLRRAGRGSEALTDNPEAKLTAQEIAERMKKAQAGT